MRKLQVYFPFLLLILLIAVDRMLTTPPLLEAGRTKPSRAEFLEGVVLATGERFLNEADTAADRRSIVFLGSSRSNYFSLLVSKPSHFGTHTNPEGYISETRLGVPGMDALSLAYTVHNLRRLQRREGRADGPIFDYIVIEASPFTVYNTKLSYRRWYSSVYAESFLREYLLAFPDEMRSDAAARLLFRTYNYKTSLPRLLKALKGSPEYQDTDQQSMISYFAHVAVAADDDLTDYDPDSVGPHVFMAPFQGPAAKAKRAVIADYDAQVAMGPTFRQAVQDASGLARRVILWLPPTHPIFSEKIYAAENVDGRFWERYFAVIESTGLPFLNGYDLLSRCYRFRDASHYGASCFDLLTSEILKCAESCPVNRTVPGSGGAPGAVRD